MSDKPESVKTEKEVREKLLHKWKKDEEPRRSDGEPPPGE
jgi:hypothetical protein